MSSDYFRRDMTYDEAPQGSKNEDWVPVETEAYISAAIDRIRTEYGMSNTGIVKEWYYNNAEMTERELVGVMRRMARRHKDLADYHAQPEPLPTHGFASARPKTTVRVCANPACGVTYIARSATSRYHDPACQRAAQRARDKARKETA